MVLLEMHNKACIVCLTDSTAIQPPTTDEKQSCSFMHETSKYHNGNGVEPLHKY